MTNLSTLDELQTATRAAKSAARSYAAVSASDRARFLEAIASQIEDLGDELIETAMAETNLPRPRLEGERGRTCGQLRMFANLICSDAWLDVRIETADPDRKPLPKPDLRQTKVPIGPVAVFGASNFPLAFSVAGGDTASALAAACPVVCKAHPYHPETSRLASHAIAKAVQECGMPEGVFSIVWGGAEIGQALVKDLNIAAVGFTGSLRAGRAIYDLAASREVPIPVFAEMGSVNPVFLMPSALESRGESIAQGYAGSLALGVGQFCTNPGVVVGVEGPAMDRFVAGVTDALKAVAPGTMLHPAISQAYEQGVNARCSHPNLTELLSGSGAVPSLYKTTGSQFIEDRSLQEELFGPSGIVVTCKNFDEMQEVSEALEGQLTLSVHFDSADTGQVQQLLPIFAEKAGRIVANGFPTGVEVNSAMQHGGPYPATTDSRSTSVGTAAILRFLRPVAFQDFPLSFLPKELQ